MAAKWYDGRDKSFVVVEATLAHSHDGATAASPTGLGCGRCGLTGS
jgi:hypothetical protein